MAAWKLSPEEQVEFRRKGHFYKRIQEGGLHGLPDFYQDAYHSRDYVMTAWSRYFQPIAYIANGPMYLQDTIVLEKSDRRIECLNINLPIGAFWSPKIADSISGETLTVAGWTFQHGGGPVPVKVYVDEEAAGSTMANLPTPGVGDVFPAFAAAGNCGFSKDVSIANLRQGPHVVRIGAEGKPIPHSATYFFVESAS